MKTATCKKCGIREPATYASNNYRCASCEAELVETIRRMSDDGDSMRIIGVRLGMSCTQVGNRMRDNGIKPAGHPEPQAGLVNGFGQPPAKLMPSREALRACSIWSVAGVVHGNESSFFLPR